jgi:hypothetical protein
VAWALAYSSGNFQSTNSEIGVVNFKGLDELADSSINFNIEAAVNDLVVDPV